MLLGAIAATVHRERLAHHRPRIGYALRAYPREQVRLCLRMDRFGG